MALAFPLVYEESIPRHTLHEKIGSGPTLPCPDYPYSTVQPHVSRKWIDERADYWSDRGYQIDWPSDWQDWFIATKKGEPTIFVTLQQHRPQIDSA